MRGSTKQAREERSVSSLRIVPINRIDSEMLVRLGHCLEERFLVEARLESPVPVAATEVNRERDQLFFNVLVTQIAAVYPTVTDPILAVTEYDLYKTTQRFVFSGASDAGRIAVVSLHRLAPERDAGDDSANLLFQRLLKQATHALGRAFGLGTCHTEYCVMAVASTMYELDRHGSYFCESCERKHRLHQE